MTQGLLALEQEGFVMRGAFSGEHHEEWCEQRLLARIHRYSLNQTRIGSPLHAVSFPLARLNG